MSTSSDEAKWLSNIEKLNSKPEFHLFEVGPSGILLGGDIELSKGPDDEFEAKVTGVKPGIWHVVITRQMSDQSGMEEFKHAIACWVAPGPLDVPGLTAGLPSPNLAPLTEWKKLQGYSVDSGAHGLVDKDGFEKITAEDEDEGKAYVLETMSDLSGDGKVSAQIGFVVSGDDGGYTIWGRSHEGRKVEIMVKPNEDDGDDGGDDEENEDEDDE